MHRKDSGQLSVFMQQINCDLWCIIYEQMFTFLSNYRKVPKFSDARKLCRNLPNIQTKRPNHRVCCQKNENGIANSEDPDQTAPLGAV